jgi:hypothetical protein
MIIFEIQSLREFEGVMPVGKLLRNKKCLMDRMERAMERDSLIQREWPVLMALLHDMANRLCLPESRCRKLRIRSCPGLSVFELKSKHLRLYVLREDFTGLVLTMGGRKTEQKEDLRSLQLLIVEYCQYRMKR